MELSSKQHVMDSFFRRFEEKVGRLPELRKTYADEAFTLCLVYIDRLASGKFGRTEGKNRENFWRALTQLSGNPLFGMIHPRQLKELAQRYCASVVPFIESVIKKRPHELLDEDNLATEIRKSSLLESEKLKLIAHLWRASMASIAYDLIRGAEVHGPGSGGLSFDETEYKGKKE